MPFSNHLVSTTDRTSLKNIFTFYSDGPVLYPSVQNITGVLGEQLTIVFVILSALPPVERNDIHWHFISYDSTFGSGSVSGSGIGSGIGDEEDVIEIEIEEGTPRISFSEDGLSLTISELQYVDEGVYTVTVENKAGADTAMAAIFVQGEGYI